MDRVPVSDGMTLHFWAPEIDPAHPLSDLQEAHVFHTHEAALRAAIELHRLGSGSFDVVKVD